MFKISRVISAMVFLLAAVPAHAQIFKWVDSDGRTHFSQTPPDTQEAPEVAKIVRIKQKNSRYKQVNGIAYCGDRKLPGRKDPVDQLLEVTGQIENWTDSIQRLQLQKSEVVKQKTQRDLSYRNARSYSSNSFQQRIRSIDERIADLNCAIDWAKQQKTDLADTREKFLADYEKSVQEFEAFKNQCGPRPDIEGYTTDPSAKEWMRCESARSTKEHNKRLREVKRLKTIAGLLQ